MYRCLGDNCYLIDYELAFEIPLRKQKHKFLNSKVVYTGRQAVGLNDDDNTLNSINNYILIEKVIYL